MFLIEDKRFYVYIYLDSLKPGVYNYIFDDITLSFSYEPIYVGEGKENRLNDHIREAKIFKIEPEERHQLHYNQNKNIRILKILESNKEPIVLKLFEHLSKPEASKIERKIIKLIGRENLKTGPLTNKSSGSKNNNYFKWKTNIDKYYTQEKRKDVSFKNTLEGSIKKYGEENGIKLYNDKNKRIAETIHETYKSQELRDKCKNFGEKNGFYGKIPKNAVRVEIFGVVYNSMCEASRFLKIPGTTLEQRLKTKKPGYIILGKIN
jgi:hypothetical protein